MDNVEIRMLERRVDELIRLIERLREENHLLRERHDLLLSERTRLIERSEVARTRVEAMIARLKVLEQEP